MKREEFFERFNIRLNKFKYGFNDINGKKYYSLTNDKRLCTANCNMLPFEYYLFLNAYFEMAKSINEEVIRPYFVNAECKKGLIKGDLIMEDFSKSETKVKVPSFDGNMDMLEMMDLFKELSEEYNNSSIWQSFIKHLLFHIYVGDDDFHHENIEVFLDNNGNTRVSPMFDFDGVFYLDNNGKYQRYSELHLIPSFALEEWIEKFNKDAEEKYTNDDFENDFFVNVEKIGDRRLFIKNIESKELEREVMLRAISELKDKTFINRLLNINIDECLSDEIFTDKFKTIIKAGVMPGRNAIQYYYNLYQNKHLEESKECE